MEVHQLCSLASFYRKQYYGTWIHPCSRLPHQLDHIIGLARGPAPLHRLRLVPLPARPNSDHRAVGCRMQVVASIRRKADQRSKLLGRCHSSLYTEGGRRDYADAVVQRLAADTGAEASASSYSAAAAAMEATALEVLPKKARPQPAWFEADAQRLLALLAARNATLNAHHSRPSSETLAARTRARSKLQAGIRAARSAWVVDKCRQLSVGIVARRGTSSAWKLVSELRLGLCGARQRPAPAKMRKPDGSLAASPEENAAVFRSSFGKLYGCTPSFDASMPELLRQRPVAADLDHPPTEEETRAALGKLRDTGPGDSGLPARFWKALGATAESFRLVHNIVLAFWETEEMPTEWETGLLKILPKKGDKSDPANYRGIMLLEVAYKIVANIVHMRLQVILESRDHVDHEPQMGFRSGRGTSDASLLRAQAAHSEAAGARPRDMDLAARPRQGLRQGASLREEEAASREGESGGGGERHRDRPAVARAAQVRRASEACTRTHRDAPERDRQVRRGRSARHAARHHWCEAR